MSQPTPKALAVLPTWVDSSLLKGIFAGIERESLRMQSNGFLSQADHPATLGSALTHPHITTDYSEALMQFITPPKTSIPEALNFLADIHAVVHAQAENGKTVAFIHAMYLWMIMKKISVWHSTARQYRKI